jgi:uncharacterized protein (TIGR02001 family)
MIAPTAQAEITANVALTSDYVWRGVSQNQEDPALQGGFDFSDESGFYAGIWGSNVNFGDASTELDLYGGWGTEFSNGVGIDFGIIRYAYVGSNAASSNDFTEYYAGFSIAGFGFNYSLGDEFGDQIEASYSRDIGTVSLAVAIGQYDPNDDGNDYTYGSLGLSGSFGGKSDLGWDVTYHDTDQDFNSDADGRIAFTISKEF